MNAPVTIKRHQIKITNGEYIKNVIAGVKAEPPHGRYEALVALYSAKAAIGCVVGRGNVASRRVRAEINRVTADGFEWPSLASRSD